MPFVCYRKSNLQIVSYSGTLADKMHTGEKEIELNVIPNLKGTLDDYGFVEISDAQEIERIGRQCSFVNNSGVIEFIIGEPCSVEPQEPDITQQIAMLKEKIASLEVIIAELQGR